jgi:hypothetical protein
MPTICGTITSNLSVNCTNPLQAGAEDTLYLINREDWLDAAITYNVTNTEIIENIVLASGIVAYTYQGKNNSVVPKYELVKQTYAEVYNHEINFKVFDVSPSAKEQLELLAKGQMVAIVQNKYKGTDGNAAFEVYGADAGLVCTQNIREVSSTDTGGAFDLILKSDETAMEPHMPKSVFITDYATTKAIVEGLPA